MQRYILRFRGEGTKPPADVERIRALPMLRVVDDAGGRVMLVEAESEELTSLLDSMPDWVLSKEQMVPLPNPRLKVRPPK